jgi:S-adenosylmethionine synthetase
MDREITILESEFSETRFEFVELKGRGHPDTLADDLAFALSRKYARYTLENFGAILHHNFDKIGLLGGASFVRFGEGRITEPIRVLLNGRASTRFGNAEIPVYELLIDASREFLASRLPNVDPIRHIEFHKNLSTRSSPGRTEEDSAAKGTRKYWFEPRGLDDLSELRRLAANDTSLGSAYAPLSSVERLVLELEAELTDQITCRNRLWLGSDIKIMASRKDDMVDLTICVPQIANNVTDLLTYKDNVDKVRRIIEDTCYKKVNINPRSISINTRDNYELCELYLTATGSSIESGDEGFVGRGNRFNGIISVTHPYSMEGFAGKNPVYHAGLLYNAAADTIARRINAETGARVEVYLISQSGRDLNNPWQTVVRVSNGTDRKKIQDIVNFELSNFVELTRKIISGKWIH